MELKIPTKYIIILGSFVIFYGTFGIITGALLLIYPHIYPNITPTIGIALGAATIILGFIEIALGLSLMGVNTKSYKPTEIILTIDTIIRAYLLISGNMMGIFFTLGAMMVLLQLLVLPKL